MNGHTTGFHHLQDHAAYKNDYGGPVTLLHQIPAQIPAEVSSSPCGPGRCTYDALLTMTKAPLVPSDPGQDSVSAGAVATAVALGMLTLMTLAGNMLVFLAVASDKKLRNVSNLFIVSLSLADLLVGTVVMVPAALSEVFQRWVLGEAFCPVWASFDVMLCSASVLNVCLISFDRYLSIMTPLRYNALMTAKRAALLLLIAWSIAVASSFVPISNGWHNPEHNSLTNLTTQGPVPQCVLRVSLPYALTASFVTIFLPIIIAFILYCRVSSEAKRQALFVRSLIAPSRVLLGQELTTSSIREPFTRKATLTLGVIVGAYVVTWTPFLVTNVIDAHCKCVPSKVFGAFVWLGYCNSLINPIIYPLLMRDFRKVYMAQLRACCPGLAFAFLRKSPKHPDTNTKPNSRNSHDHSSVTEKTQHLIVYDKADKNSLVDRHEKASMEDKLDRNSTESNGHSPGLLQESLFLNQSPRLLHESISMDQSPGLLHESIAMDQSPESLHESIPGGQPPGLLNESITAIQSPGLLHESIAANQSPELAHESIKVNQSQGLLRESISMNHSPGRLHESISANQSLRLLHGSTFLNQTPRLLHESNSV